MGAVHDKLPRPQRIEDGRTDHDSIVEAKPAKGAAGGPAVEDQRDCVQIEEDARTFLQVNTTCVISTLMPDGSPHASAVHFAAADRCHFLFFCINKNSRTAKNVILDDRVAIAVGVDCETPTALQMRGYVTVTRDKGLKEAEREFYSRFPHSSSYKDDPDTVFLQFSPTWAQYSNGKSHQQFFVRGFSRELLEL